MKYKQKILDMYHKEKNSSQNQLKYQFFNYYFKYIYYCNDTCAIFEIYYYFS